MNERVKRLTEEARRLSPEELAELLAALMAMAKRDNDEIDPALWDGWNDIGAESLGYIQSGG